MIFYLIILAVVIGAFFFAKNIDDAKPIEKCAVFILATISLSVISSLFLLGISSSFEPNTVTKREIYTNSIVSLHTNSATQGSFFLGCGQISGEEKYVFMMYDFSKEGYVRSYSNAHETIVKETTCGPSFSYDWVTYENTSGYFWWPKYLRSSYKQRENFILEVPAGTIIKNFNIE